MEVFYQNLLSIIVFLPSAGALLVALLPKQRGTEIKYLALAISLLNFIISLLLLVGFNAAEPSMQFQEVHRWIPGWGISYRLGVDGVSLFLVLLTTFLSLLSILISWTEITTKLKEYMIFMLLLQTGMIGVFVALDLFLFYVFWEVTLIPMYFIIGIWGGPRRIYAAVKFVLFTLFGSLLMLVAILSLAYLNYQHTGAYSFDLNDLSRVSSLLPLQTQIWLFAAFALAFAVKVPMFPLHTWLPDAHVEAPTAGSVLLAGVLLKMGSYGFIRFCLPLFPDASQAAVPLMGTVAVISIIYGAIAAAGQKDIKRLVAYSSVSHMGFIMLGIFALNTQGLAGSSLQMVNHGLTTGALFLMVGMLYERRHTRMIADFGGVAKQMPIFSAFLLLMVLGSIGLPGLNGFVGEFLILLGSFISSAYANLTYAVLAATGVVLSAMYMLWFFRRVMQGELREENRSLPDLRLREIVIMASITLFVFWIGIFPGLFLNRIEASLPEATRQSVNWDTAARQSESYRAAVNLALPSDYEQTAASRYGVFQVDHGAALSMNGAFASELSDLRCQPISGGQ